jgi:trk system potassium uptake protein TrkH
VNQFWRRWLTPPKALVLGYAIIITIGALLLKLPIATADGSPLDWPDALFTATSAACVTGLSVVDTGTHFSIFGQVVILFLIQVGGIGFMTMAVVISVLIGRRVSLFERLLVKESLGQIKVQGMVRLVLYITAVALAAEILGAIWLWFNWQSELGPLRSAWFAVFHSVSAFANAGFDLFGSEGQISLNGYRKDVLVNVVIGGLIILGSLGMPVLDELIRWPKTRRFSVHTLLVLTMSILLLIGGTAVLLITETESRSPVGQLPWGERFLVSAFHATSARTGGFSTIALTDMSAAGWFVLMALMFTGAATASMGGGIKINVLGVLLMTLWSVARGREEVVAFGRTIPRETIYKALTIMFSSATFVMLITILLTITEHLPPLHLLFETVSAFGTVGFSLGVTPNLSTAGKLLIVITMFAGRLGVLTMIAALARHPSAQLRGYPEEKILIG